METRNHPKEIDITPVSVIISKRHPVLGDFFCKLRMMPNRLKQMFNFGFVNRSETLCSFDTSRIQESKDASSADFTGRKHGIRGGLMQRYGKPNLPLLKHKRNFFDDNERILAEQKRVLKFYAAQPRDSDARTATANSRRLPFQNWESII